MTVEKVKKKKKCCYLVSSVHHDIFLFIRVSDIIFRVYGEANIY